MNEIRQKLLNILPVWMILVSFSIGYGQDTLYVPDFSVQRGFYESPFNVVVTSDKEGASIVYTLDGSDPTTSQNFFTAISPATIYVDPEDETGRFTSPCVLLRAITALEGFESSSVVTHTYLFLNKIIELSPDEQKPGSGWPERNMSNNDEQYMDYGIDPEILNDLISWDEVQ